MGKFAHLLEGNTVLVVALLVAVVVITQLSKPNKEKDITINNDTNTVENCKRNNGYYLTNDGDWRKCKRPSSESNELQVSSEQ